MGQHLQEYHGNGDGICGNSNCTFIRRLLKSDFSQAPPTSMRAQTRQFLTIASTVPMRCPRSSNCQADCSTLWVRKHGSFWVQNGQCVCVRWSFLHGQRIVVGHMYIHMYIQHFLISDWLIFLRVMQDKRRSWFFLNVVYIWLIRTLYT